MVTKKESKIIIEDIKSILNISKEILSSSIIKQDLLEKGIISYIDIIVKGRIDKELAIEEIELDTIRIKRLLIELLDIINNIG